MKRLKKILLTLLVLALLLVTYILFNTFTFESRQITAEPVTPIEVDNEAKNRFAKALTIETVSYENEADFDSSAFYAFNDFLKTTYPLTDSLLQLTYINKFSHIYKWQGSDLSLKPVILMGHIDVVPVLKENLSKWNEKPFAGLIKDGVVWGRGAIDDKISVIGNLEAVEYLIKQNYQPRRSLYLCFGHDEELGGENGAIAIVEHLKQLNVEAEYVMDEGLAITQGLIPGADKDVALIGTAEKGFITLKLSVEIEGGHSSMPKSETAIDVMANAIAKLKANPFPAKITQPLADFMQYMGPEMPFLQKMAFANPGLFESMIISTYEKEPSGNALVRTTTSPTIMRAGAKDNIIPYTAEASVNFRVLPGTTIDEVKQRVTQTINDDRIKIAEGSFSSEAPESSSTDSFAYETIQKTIKQIFPEVIVSPNLVTGATDSRHYYPLSKDIYRFTPFYINESNINTFHGVNERLSVEDFENAIRFYVQLVKNSTTK